MAQRFGCNHHLTDEKEVVDVKSSHLIVKQVSRIISKRMWLALSVMIMLFNFFTPLKAQQKNTSHKSKKPNIIFILTDDLGIGDLGVFFQNQRRLAGNRNEPFTVTPFLDQMAENGAMLNQYCAAPVCAPSRASLMLGQSQGHANVRDNQFDKALAENYTLGNVMQMAGYKTVIVGKWGLQGEGGSKENPEGWPAHPLKRGFDDYMGYIRHEDGHEHYPKEGIYRGRKEVYEGYKEISNTLDKCYTGDLFTAYAKKYIIDHQKGRDKNKPFFMFLSFDTPHAVLELPTQAYPTGFGLDGGLKWTGIPGAMINTASGKPDSWFDPVYENASYDEDNDSATAEVSWPDINKRYATINKRIDNQVHDILVLLKDLKIDENTLVVFTSDNGPSIESYIKDEPIAPNFFGSYGQFDGIKRDTWEGGIRMPTIAYWPKHIKRGAKINTPSISYDWMPTFLDLANLPAPVVSDGVSLLPNLIGKMKPVESKIYIEYFEDGHTPNFKEFDPSHRNRKRGQMQMVRMGDTVAIRYDIKSNSDDFEIYDIKKDPKQRTDLAKTKSLISLQKRLKREVLQERLADSSAPRPYDNALIPSEKIKTNLVNGWNEVNYHSNTKWISAPIKTKTGKRVSSVTVNGKENMFLYTGYVKIPESGHYTFKLSTSNQAFIRLHEIALFDADYTNTFGKDRSQTLNLQKGYHPIKLYIKKGVAHPDFKLEISEEGEKGTAIDGYVFSAE